MKHIIRVNYDEMKKCETHVLSILEELIDLEEELRLTYCECYTKCVQYNSNVEAADRTLTGLLLKIRDDIKERSK